MPQKILALKNTVESTDSTGSFHTTTETPEIPFGQNCSSSGGNCTSNLICDNTNKCACQSDYYYKNSTNSCSENIPVGQNCSPGIDKCVSNLICDNTTNKCGCQSDYYYKNSTNSCSQNIPVGQNCSPGIDKCVSNLICDNTTNKCGCQSDYYYKNSTNSCSQKLDHGAICQTTQTSLQCKPANTVCTSDSTLSTNRCLCDSGFYWTDYSLCNSRSNLKITAPSTNRETRTVIFVWIDMSQRSNVNYSIKWNGSNTRNANKDGVTVTGLVPGTSYSFTVVTSLPGDGNYQPIIVEQPQTALWTRPDSPGTVIKAELVDNSTSTYAITFGQSNGSVSYYTMSVSTVESTPISNNSTSTVMYFTPLKAATTYSYILESFNGYGDNSDKTTGQFPTDSEESGPVSGFNYTEIQSHTASVKWQTPTQSNGNITGYLVEVALQNTPGCVYYITISCHGCDQVAPNISEQRVPSCILMDANVTGSGNDYNLQLPNLTPYRNYTVTVRAVNVKGLGEPTILTFQTSTSAPNEILDLTVYSVRDDSTQKINLNIAWTPGDLTGPTDYYILVQEAAGQDTSEHNQSTSPLIVTGYGSTTYVTYDVLAYWNYTVCVWAQTDKGNSSQECAQNRTVENYPGAVPSLNVSQDATVANIVTLTFECPEIRSRNGSIEQFVITQTHLDSQGQEIREIYTQSAFDGQSEPCSNEYKVTVKNITVERDYSFSVVTVNNKYGGGVKVSKFYIQPKVPHLVNPQEMFNVGTLVKQQNGSAIELTKINADICSTCLTDVRWGTVINVGILVCVKGADCAVSGRKKRSTALQFTQIPTWGSAKLQDFKIEYRTTPNKWVPPVNGNNKYNPFVVGDNTTCSHANATDFCNGPLPAGQEVYISVIMCTTAGCSTYREPHVFATYVPDTIVKQTHCQESGQVSVREDDDSHIGAIVGGVLGGLALIAVIGVFVYLIRKAQFKRGLRKPIRKNPDTQVTGRDRLTPRQTFSEHIDLPQLPENSHIYDEINDYDYITEGGLRSVRHSQPHKSLVNNVRSHRDVHKGTRDSTESQFPYENVVSVNRDQDDIRYENYL